MKLFGNRIKKFEIINAVLSWILLTYYLASSMYAAEFTREAGFVMNPFLMMLLDLSLLVFCISTQRIKVIGKQNKYFKYFLWGYLVLSLTGTVITPYKSLSEFLRYPLPILSFYFIYRLTLMCERRDLIPIAFSISFFYLFIYYINMREYIYEWMLEEDNQNSASYMLLHLLPLILCVERKWIKIIAIVFTVIAITISLKRGGLVALAIGLVVYFYAWSNSSMKKSTVFIKYLVSGAILFAVYYAFMRYNIVNDKVFLNRFNESGDIGSGRDEVWKHSISMILESNPFLWMVGHGHNAVSYFSRLQCSAHNDILEIIYDYGLIMLCWFLFIIKGLFSHAKHLSRINSIYKPAFVMSIGILLINISISHVVLYIHYLCIYCFFWGFIFAEEQKRNYGTYNS